jgi:cytidyltransferase-like protein
MNPLARPVAVTGGFDDLRSAHLRFLEEASRLGPVTVLLWPDEVLLRLTRQSPKFPLAERRYLLSAVRYVAQVHLAPSTMQPDCLPAVEGFRPAVWVDGECRANTARQTFCQAQGLEYHIIGQGEIHGFPDLARDANVSPDPGSTTTSLRKKVVVTGCYDWFHSGHVRFFEEASAYGDLYVIVGHDANIRLLKGEGHPLRSQEERRYVVGAIRFVKQALISSGEGWLDADPEIRRLQPDLYVVNEDGDRGGKREYCQQHGMEYVVLRRVPAPGLPGRSSTALRGF